MHAYTPRSVNVDELDAPECARCGAGILASDYYGSGLCAECSASLQAIIDAREASAPPRSLVLTTMNDTPTFEPPPDEYAVAALLSRTVAVYGGDWAGYLARPAGTVRLVVSAGRSRRGTGTRYHIAGVRERYDLLRAPSRRCHTDEEAIAWANEWAEKHRLSERLPLPARGAA